MKKQYRLKKNEDFQKIIRKNRNLASSSFAAYFARNDLGHARVGISVSAKLGKAVVRNRIKRQVRMMAQQAIDLSKNADFVFIVRKHYLGKSYAENYEEFKRLVAEIVSLMDKEV